MGLEAGLFAGFLGRKGEVEKENLRAAELAAAREVDVYKALLGSENPEIQAMATAGLLESASPKKRKGGLKGWLGEMESSPTFGRLMSYLQTPQPVTEELTTLPARHITDMRATALPGLQPQTGAGPGVQPTVTEPPPAAGAAAQAPTSPVQPGGGPPPAPMAYTTSPPTPYSMQTGRTALPQVFLTPEQRMRREIRLKAEGEGIEITEKQKAYYTAFRQAGDSHEEATRRSLELVGNTARSTTARFGGLVRGSDLPLGTLDSFGRPTEPTAFYRRETLNGREQFIPTLPPSAQIGTLRVLASPNGRPAIYRIYPDNTMEFVREVPAGVDQIPVQHPDGSMEIVPVPRQFQAPSAAEPMATSPAAAVGPPQAGPQAPSTPPPTPAAVTAQTQPTRGPAGGLQTKPSEADQAATKRATTRLSTAENAQYGTPEGTTWGDVDRQGLVPMKDDVRKAVDQIDVALAQITKMESLAKKVFGGTAPAIARGVPVIGGAMERIAQEGSLTWAMNSEDYRNLVAARNMAIPGVARRTGEVGNLTATEQERAAEALPNLGEGAINTPDTLGVALSKLAALKEQLTTQRGIFQRGTSARRAGGPPAPDAAIPEELKAAPPNSVWEDEQGVPRWKKLADGSIVPY